MTVHLVKLCVGIDRLDELAAWQKQHLKGKRGKARVLRHVTRMTPKRGDELLDGGSLYWVIKGVIEARQEIVGLEAVRGRDGIGRCAIILSPKLVPTRPQPRRPFQGWRYLKAEDAPADLDLKGSDAELPAQMKAELKDLGLL